MSEIREDYLPGCGYKIYQDPAEFTFTTDSVFLARFPHLVNKAKVLELGCGTGAISFYLAARGAAEATGLDVNPRMVELFNRSAEANGIFWQDDGIRFASSKEELPEAAAVNSGKTQNIPEENCCSKRRNGKAVGKRKIKIKCYLYMFCF